MVNGLRAVLFDLDGVLIDSEYLFYCSVRDAFRPHRIEISEQEYVRRWMIEQTNAPGVIRDYALNITVQQLRKEKSIIEDSYIPKIMMMDGAMDLLKRFQHLPYGLVTSETRNSVLRKTNKHNLLRFFQVSVCADEAAKSKSQGPEPYLKGCELLGVEPSDVMVVEDNPTGARSANLAGCRVVVRPHGFTLNMEFPYAHARIKEFNEINDELIRRLFQR